MKNKPPFALATTVDALLNGTVQLRQPAPGFGYRFNVDALLLAQFAKEFSPQPSRVLDLGAGVGAVGVVYSAMTRPQHLRLIDIDPVSCDLAAENLRQLQGVDVRVQQGDVATHEKWKLRRSFDVILMNPPYALAHTGRPASEDTVRRARQGALRPFLEAGQELLSVLGSLYICYPAQSLPRLATEASRAGLNISHARFVHGSPNKAARLVLVRTTHRPSDAVTVCSPLFG